MFVGKLLPHKAAHDLVRALAAYQSARTIPSARLVLVGGHPIASYAEAVRDYAGSLGLADAVEMTGATSNEELASAYASADVFVCLSDHEGFCFPLLEAMNHGVPIVAYAAGAVADTLGDAGILLRDKSGPTVAAAVHRAITDARLRERIVAAGRKRLRRIRPGTHRRSASYERRRPGSSSDRRRHARWSGAPSRGRRRSFEPPEGGRRPELGRRC